MCVQPSKENVPLLFEYRAREKRKNDWIELKLGDILLMNIHQVRDGDTVCWMHWNDENCNVKR